MQPRPPLRPKHNARQISSLVCSLELFSLGRDPETVPGLVQDTATRLLHLAYLGVCTVAMQPPPTNTTHRWPNRSSVFVKDHGHSRRLSSYRRPDSLRHRSVPFRLVESLGLAFDITTG